MQRRMVIAGGLGLLAGCAQGAATGHSRHVERYAPERAPQTPSVPPPPPPPPPPDNPAFLATPEPRFIDSGDPAFDAWRRRIIEFWGDGWRPYLVRLLATLQPISPATALPAARVTGGFVRTVLTDARVAEGRQRMKEPWLMAIAARDGVPAEVLAALWGAASAYGADSGSEDMLAWWATRSAAGGGDRDPDFGEAARLVVAGAAPRAMMRCFADGSFGQLRFFPRQQADWGVDGDNDGRQDPWTSPRDAVASASNMIRRGWSPGQNWVAQVLMPASIQPNDERFWEGVRRGGSVRPGYLVRADGLPWPTEDLQASGQLLQPFGTSGPTYLTLTNFEPLRFVHGGHLGPFGGREELATDWALAVGLLANALRGETVSLA